MGVPRGAADVSIELIPGGDKVAALVFEVEYDPSKLEFDFSTASKVGTSSEGAGITGEAFDVGPSRGRVGISVYDAIAPVLPLPAGPIVTLRFMVRPEAEGFAYVRIAGSRVPDAADTEGQSVTVTTPAATSGVVITSSRSRAVRATSGESVSGAQSSFETSLLIPIVERSATTLTGLAILNSSTQTLDAVATLLGERGVLGTRTIQLQPGESRNYVDVAGELFQQSSCRCALTIEPSQSGLVARATLSSSSQEQTVTAVSSDRLTRSGEAAHLLGSEASRLSIVNLSSVRLSVTIDALSQRGDILRSRVAQVEPHGIALRIAIELEEAVAVRITSATDGALFHVFATPAGKRDEVIRPRG